MANVYQSDTMIAFAIINGASNGGFFAIMPTVVGNMFGSQRLAVAIGMIVTAWAGGYLMGAPIAGYILEAYGGPDAGSQAFRPAIHYSGSLSLAASGMVLAAKLSLSKTIFRRV